MPRAQLHLYFGEGKGKTTAALGQSVRALGHGWRVLFVQFLKDARAASGEAEAAAALGPRFRLVRSRMPAPVLVDPGPEGRARLRASSVDLLERVRRELRGRRVDLLVLDEALVAAHFRFLTVAALRRVVREAGASGVHLVVLTGRWAPASLLRAADLATEMRKVRHHYDRGVTARHGIEY